jgi:hypothetical protein
METDTIGVPTMMGLLDASPGGGTPLCFHVNEVMKQIIEIAPQLKAAGKKAALVICTDGEASDGDIASVLRKLHTLPVWVVIRYKYIYKYVYLYIYIYIIYINIFIYMCIYI